jgi:hypothetical protein
MHRKVLFLRDGEDGGGNVLWFAARIEQTEDAKWTIGADSDH